MKERIKAALKKWRETGKGMDMAVVLTEQLQSSPDGNVERIRDMLLQRSVVGFKKYGVTTTESNIGTEQWLQHLQEELLDAAVYVETLKQKMIEARSMVEQRMIGESDAS